MEPFISHADMRTLALLAAELAAECEDKGSRAGHAWNRLHATLAAMAMGLLALEQKDLLQSNLEHRGLNLARSAL